MRENTSLGWRREGLDNCLGADPMSAKQCVSANDQANDMVISDSRSSGARVVLSPMTARGGLIRDQMQP